MISVSADLHFTLADESHDAAIRKLLQECPMPGAIQLSLQREPSYFAAAGIEGTEHHTMIALQDRQIVAMGSVSVRERFYNGKLVRVGYLGSLRLASFCRGRFDILRRGYQFFRTLDAKLNVPFYLTSIAADNHQAIEFLEKGLPGMPIYRHVGNLGTALVRVPRDSSPGAKLQIQRGLMDAHDSFLEHLNQSMSQFQFAPSWTAAELKSHGLREEDFRLILEDGKLQATAAMWDQRRFKQAVVNRYSGAMAFLRPIYNRLADWTGRVKLPEAGVPIAQAFVSHLSLPVDRPELLGPLLETFAGAARAGGIELLTLGFDARDPRLAWLCQHFRARVYHTRIYQVAWPDAKVAFEPADERLLYPEVALL